MWILPPPPFRPTHTQQTHARRRHATDSSQRAAVGQSEASMSTAARVKQTRGEREWARDIERERARGRDVLDKEEKRARAVNNACACASVRFRLGGRVSLSCAVAVNYLTRLAFLKQWLWNVVSLKTICVSAACNNWTGLHTCMCTPCLWYHDAGEQCHWQKNTHIRSSWSRQWHTISCQQLFEKTQRKHTNSCFLPFRQPKNENVTPLYIHLILHCIANASQIAAVLNAQEWQTVQSMCACLK